MNLIADQIAQKPLKILTSRFLNLIKTHIDLYVFQSGYSFCEINLRKMSC
jgi:hypothetical protein